MLLPDSIKAIVFDAYGTLFDVQSLIQRLQGHFGKNADQINQVWRRKQLEYTWLRGLMQEYQPFSAVTAEALEFACQANGQKLSEDTLLDLVAGYYELAVFDGLGSELKDLAQHYQLAVLSNADENMLNAALINSELTELFSAVLSVNQIKHYKPAPKVYELAVETLGHSASEIAFISSNTWDVAGAANFGLHVVWLNRNNGYQDLVGRTPKHVIKNLSELLR